MKSNYWLLTVIFALVALPGKAGEWIRINQLGYLPQSVKVAVFMSEEGTNVENYSLIDAFTGKVVRTFNTTKATGKMGGMKSTYRLNFSDFTEPGTYYLKAGKAVSPRFPINAQVYNGTADYLLHYMRQQRCGYNPFLKDSCHVHDGYIVYHPTKTGQHIDVRGGWHDATDYLQYTTTSANAIYQSPFLHGIPYIWCSNNLTTAMLTQCRLYRETTGDDTYAEMEASLRDWLFGCNPWGTSMIVELPLYGDYPSQPHSSLLNAGVGNTTGGLVDGPVYRTIFESLRGVNMTGIPGTPGQDYERFQPDLMVYHDAIHDYSTNEPTMDGTACLTYYLSAMQKDGMKQAGIPNDKNVYVDGGIIRTDPSKKQITLVFTAADKADGADAIISTLKKHGIKGGFFFTGEFYELYPDVVKRLLDEGHFVGSHSYGHLLYMPWEDRDSLLVTHEEFENDMMKSYETLRKASIEYKDAPVYIPPYEYYNKEISAWAKNMGIQVINYTPGTMSNADYTTPDMGQKYRSSKFIYNKIMEVEKKEGLNGHLMLIHFGTDDRRTDKFYNGYLDKMIKTLKRKGYTFVPVREAVGI